MFRYLLAARMLTAVWALSSIGKRQRWSRSSQSSPSDTCPNNHVFPHHAPKACEPFQDEKSLVLGRDRRKLLQSVPFLLMTTAAPTTAWAGGQFRCYSDDPRCRADGTVRELETKPIPRVTNQITHVAQITYTIGERLEEVGFIRVGLYGNDCPSSVKELLLFLSSGLITMSEEQRQGSIGMQSVPVGLLCGGIVPNIYPGTAVEFGVPSQSKAYAASRGMRNAGPDFVPQPRPVTQRGESFPRPHDVAGLVSIPEGGIGNGGRGSESDDDAFASAFLITADAAPLLDSAKTKHRVVGQVIDDASMTNLARLASLPVQKGLTGALPGQGYGSPLLKVTIQDVGVQRVK